MSELRPNGRGGFSRVAKGETPPEEDLDKKGKPFPGAAKPFGPGGEKPKEETDEEKAKAKKAAEDADEEKRKAAQKMDEEGMALAKDVAGIAEELQKLSESLEAEEGSEPSDVHMKKMIAQHKALGGMCDKYMAKVGKLAVAKVGAKMSAPRLESFKASLAGLQAILAELMETPGSVAEHAADAGDPTKPGPVTPPMNGVGTAAIKQLEGHLETLTKRLMTVVDIAKTQGVELAKLRKGVDGSNALPVGGSSVRKGTPVEWPMDMNGRGRAAVDKSDSFLDP